MTIRASGSMAANFGHRLLNVAGAGVGAIMHRHPAEQDAQQPLLLKSVSQGASGVQELQLDDRANCDDASGQLV